MPDLHLVKGTTSKLLQFTIGDTSDPAGGGLTGLLWNTSGLSAYYYREGAASATSITLATMTMGTWATGGFVAVDGTNMPGVYQLGIPDAALASGANSVIIMVKGDGTINMAPIVFAIQLTDINMHDAVRGGMTALPNAAAEAAGGLYTRGTSAGQINQDAAGRIDVNPILTIANGVETGLTLLQTLRLMVAALAGKVSGAGTTTVVIRNIADSKDRITATVDASGNRSAITTDLT